MHVPPFVVWIPWENILKEAQALEVELQFDVITPVDDLCGPFGLGFVQDADAFVPLRGCRSGLEQQN